MTIVPEEWNQIKFQNCSEVLQSSESFRPFPPSFSYLPLPTSASRALLFFEQLYLSVQVDSVDNRIYSKHKQKYEALKCSLVMLKIKKNLQKNCKIESKKRITYSQT